MKIVFFGTDIDIIDEWISKYNLKLTTTCCDIDELNNEIKNQDESIVIVDYDSVANELNKLISSDHIPQKTIVLEKAPEILTGKMLISHNIKAYANSRISSVNFSQMFETVLENKIWTYPELTSALAKNISSPTISDDAQKLLENRLTPKEIEVIKHLLNGLTNDTIATKLGITTRTVKAHIGSIFSKLHVNDRISLVLLLK
jgi:DNA-binding NarL/FixJ family response regulator